MQVRPQVGTIVSPISEDMIMNILEVRILLEPHAAQMAASRITEEDRELLSQHFDRLARLGFDSEARKRKLFETDALLHDLIWQRCGNPEIGLILDRYRGQIQRIRLSNADLGNRLAPSEQEIRAIFDALNRGDEIESAKTLTAHLENIRTAVKSIFAALSGGSPEKAKTEANSRARSADQLKQL